MRKEERYQAVLKVLEHFGVLDKTIRFDKHLNRIYTPTEVPVVDALAAFRETDPSGKTLAALEGLLAAVLVKAKDPDCKT